MKKTVLLSLLLTTCLAVQAGSLFRYKNSDGVLVTTDTLPPDAVAKGYEIVNEHGRVLDIIAPALTGEEGEARRRKMAELAELRKQDQYLLTSFSQVEEIEALKSRKLSLLARDMQQLEDNLEVMSDREQEILRDAAGMELVGKEVSKPIKVELERVREKQLNMDRLLIKRQQEYRQIEKRYDSYITRFRQLKTSRATNSAGVIR